jgi:large subunit ribosomal protein L31e
MARLKEGESRIYTVTLKQNTLTAPKWRRTKKAVTILREYLEKHTKSDNIRISRWVNEHLWSKGGKNPPSKISVKVTKEKDNVINVELAELSERAKREAKKLEAMKAAAKESEKSKEIEEETPKDDEEENKKKAKVTKQQEKDISKKR